MLVMVSGLGRVNNAVEAFYNRSQSLGPCAHHLTQLSLWRLIPDYQGFLLTSVWLAGSVTDKLI